MNIALVHKRTSAPVTHFYWSGWLLAGHDIERIEVEGDHLVWKLAELDGKYDLILVCPGFVKNDFYRSRTHTKYILLSEEDIHESVSRLGCLCDYYPLVTGFSALNEQILNLYNIYNFKQVLPAVDETIYHRLPSLQQPCTVSALITQDGVWNIQGATRISYLSALMQRCPGALVGTGYYADQANLIYNQSKIALDLPISPTVGPRSFHIGASRAMLLLPYDNHRSALWRKTFRPGIHYAEFENSIDGMIDIINYYLTHEEERQQIVGAMNIEMTNHTFKIRFSQILRYLDVG